MIPSPAALLNLLQLASPALPVGAYSYSEGIEWLVENGTIINQQTLEDWLAQELQFGAIQLELSVMVRVYRVRIDATVDDLAPVQFWNQWLSAAKETAELQQQSWQMGGSLVKLLREIQPDNLIHTCSEPWNFAIAYLLAATTWELPLETTLTSYVQTWCSNQIGAGIKLIPIGQTQGQQLLQQLQPRILQAVVQALTTPDDQLQTCSWGLSLASMAHEAQYSRLFRS